MTKKFESCEWIAIKNPYVLDGYYCTRTKNPICPHCGKEEMEAWDIDFGYDAEGDTEVFCCSCDKPYKVYRRVDVCYST
jgi:hypothetical protein